jgi:hypothetical protein
MTEVVIGNGIQFVEGKLADDGMVRDMGYSLIAHSTLTDPAAIEADENVRLAGQYARVATQDADEYGEGLVAVPVPARGVAIFARHAPARRFGRTTLQSHYVVLPLETFRQPALGDCLAWLLVNARLPRVVSYEQQTQLGPYELVLRAEDVGLEQQVRLVQDVIRELPQPDFLLECLAVLANGEQALSFVECPRALAGQVCLALTLLLPVELRLRLSYMTAYTRGTLPLGRIRFAHGRQMPDLAGGAIADWRFGEVRGGPGLPAELADLRDEFFPHDLAGWLAYVATPADERRLPEPEPEPESLPRYDAGASERQTLQDLLAASAEEEEDLPAPPGSEPRIFELRRDRADRFSTDEIERLRDREPLADDEEPISPRDRADRFSADEIEHLREQAPLDDEVPYWQQDRAGHRLTDEIERQRGREPSPYDREPLADDEAPISPRDRADRFSTGEIERQRDREPSPYDREPPPDDEVPTSPRDRADRFSTGEIERQRGREPSPYDREPPAPRPAPLRLPAFESYEEFLDALSAFELDETDYSSTLRRVLWQASSAPQVDVGTWFDECGGVYFRFAAELETLHRHQQGQPHPAVQLLDRQGLKTLAGRTNPDYSTNVHPFRYLWEQSKLFRHDDEYGWSEFIVWLLRRNHRSTVEVLRRSIYDAVYQQRGGEAAARVMTYIKQEIRTRGGG